MQMSSKSNETNETQVVEESPQVEETVDTKEATKKEKKSPKTKELTPEEKVMELSKQRMGKFDVALSAADAKYMRNLLDRSEWKGPQQAYLLIISKLEMSQLCEELKDKDQATSHPTPMSSATIESLSFFMNNYTGKGDNAAHKLFASSMLLRPAIGEINKIDREIEELRASMNPSEASE